MGTCNSYYLEHACQRGNANNAFELTYAAPNENGSVERTYAVVSKIQKKRQNERALERTHEAPGEH